MFPVIKPVLAAAALFFVGGIEAKAASADITLEAAQADVTAVTSQATKAGSPQISVQAAKAVLPDAVALQAITSGSSDAILQQAITAGASDATLQEVKAGVPEMTLHATYAALGAQTTVPYGWVDFCHRYIGECNHETAVPIDINLTAKAFDQINKINLWVNAAIEPVTDAEHWGVADQWDYPTDMKGDCEDYALLKRRLLLGLGFPRQALLMTVVKDEHNEGHAILTIKTNRGEFVLDNLTNEIKAWADTPYRFVKRQSQYNENVWVQIGDPTLTPTLVSKR